jgi:uncharacterized protein (TIGR02597 family)
MKISSTQFRAISLAILSAIAPIGHAQTTAVTDPVGFITLNISGTGGTTLGAFTFSSLGLTNPVVYQSASSTVTSNSLTVTAGPWAANQFNANGTNPTHFVEIVTPAGAGSQAPGAGTTYDILSNTATTITLMQNLAVGVLDGAQFKVRAHWTLGSVFGANNESGLGGGSSTTADRILRWNGSGYDIFYYQTSGLGGIGWRKAGSASVNAAGTTLYPEDGLIINRFQSAPVSLVVKGAVKTGQTSIPITPGNNFVGNIYASAMTLASCGIYTGNSATGLAGGNSTGADQILIWNPTLSGGAGGYDIYYYQTSGLGGIGWRKSGAASVDASSTVIPVGQSVIISRKAAGGFSWIVPQHPASI